MAASLFSIMKEPFFNKIDSEAADLYGRLFLMSVATEQSNATMEAIVARIEEANVILL